MSHEIRIHVIDDDPMMRDAIGSLLEAEGHLAQFEDAESCAAAIAAAPPDMMLLDVELPGMDGYALCRSIKDEAATHDIPIIFVSAHDSIEARLKGYDAGGEDFIVKPFAPDELLRKVRVAKQIIADKANLREQLAMSEQLSSLALASMDESGIVLQFMSKLIGWNSEQEIADGIIDLVKRYGLRGTTQTRIGPRAYTFSAEGANRPLEVSVMNHVRTMETIFEFHNRTVFNYDRATIMVANMPLHDPDFCGRIRDNLAIAAAGANARLESIEGSEAMLLAVDGIRDTVGSIKQFHQSNQARTSQLIYELEEQLAKAFVHLGLTTGQENSIEDLVKDFMVRLASISEEGEEILTVLQTLNDRLTSLRSR